MRLLRSATALAFLLSLSAAAQAAPRVVTVKGGDDMKYTVTSITAKPGEQLTIKFQNIGKLPKMVMAHNVVVLQLGTDVKAFVDKAAQSKATDYIPAALKAQIIANTPMAGPGETVEVTFTVPKKPGSYDFVCTFPAHYLAGMKGVLVVK